MIFALTANLLGLEACRLFSAEYGPPSIPMMSPSVRAGHSGAEQHDNDVRLTEGARQLPLDDFSAKYLAPAVRELARVIGTPRRWFGELPLPRNVDCSVATWGGISLRIIFAHINDERGGYDGMRISILSAEAP